MLGAVILFAAYLAAVRFAALLYATAGASTAVIWPAAGIGVAGIFLGGYRVWPAITLASLLNSYLSGSPWPLALSIATGSTLQALAGAYLLRRFRFDPRIWRLRDMAVVVGVAAAVMIIGPTVIVSGSYLTGTLTGGAVQRWVALWLGGALSVMILTPLLTSWVVYPKLNSSPRRTVELVSAFATLIGVAIVLFWTPHTSLGGVSLVYVLLIPLFWIALSFGTRETVVALFLMAAIGFGGTIYGLNAPAATLLGQRLLQLEMFFIVFSGIFFIVSAVSEERRHAERTLRGYIGQLEQALDRIRTADQAKTEFLAVLAHELRNPLAPALSSLELIQLRRPDDPDVVAAARQAKRNVKNMGRLLDDLLDVSRISQGKIKLQKQPTNMRAVLDRALDSTRPLMESRDHRLTLDIAGNLPELMADPLRMEQVMVNLLNNAAKYTEPGGDIRFSAYVDDGKLFIRIRDNGVGIAPEKLPFIFQMFNQADASEERMSKGLGIGLGLVKKFVEMHGGTVTAKSAGEGRGSEFLVALPLNELRAEEGNRPREAVVAGAAGAPDAKNGSRKRILVIDDNEPAAGALVKLFEGLGHEAKAEYEGLKGIETALDYKPDVILLDIGLPGMNGYEVAEKLRVSDLPPHTVIAAVSGYGQEEDRQRSRRAGFDQHLVKPVDLETWRELLES